MTPFFIAMLFLVVLSCLIYAGRRAKPVRATIHTQAFAFDLSLATERYRQKTGCTEEEARRVEQEFRRFFILMAENPHIRFGLHNGAVDDYWHELICCTALYEAYCRHVARRFIHHDPQGGSGDGYDHTWWSYHDRFLETPAALYWPAPATMERPKWVNDGEGWGGSSCVDGGSSGGDHGCCGHGCSGGGGCGGGD